MSWLNFIILNGVAPIEDLHLISDAGAGEGLMQLHPSRDTELIACGHANTKLKGEYLPSPLLGNGSVTPAILVHGLLLLLKQYGFKIRLHCYQLGLNNLPDFSGCKLDEVIVHQCQSGQEKSLIEAELIPELQRQQREGEKHLIAESGIGGTTFATVWLKHWLGADVMLAGSTKDPDKLSRKEQVIEALLADSTELETAQQFISQTGMSDPIQRACCALLESELEKLSLAGGTMFFAPIIAMQDSSRVRSIEIGTTHWIMQSDDAVYASTRLADNCSLMTPAVNFNGSGLKALNMYEQGYVVEGCGLGATLVLAEQQGFSSRQIIAAMEEVVKHWLE